MAHKIDNSKGFNAFVSYREPAWHGLGKTFTEEISVREAIQHGGLDFEVIKVPNIHRLPSGVEIEGTDSFFTMRTDVEKILGTRLGADYHILQNLDAMNVIDDILATGKATIESAGVINEGRRIFVCLKVKEPILVGKNDEIMQYILFANSHDGTLSITAMPTNIRVVCNNTLSAALGTAYGAIRIRHSRNAGERFKEAAKVLKLIAENTEVNTDNYNQMRSNIISKQDMFSYFGNLFCTPEEIAKFQRGLGTNDVLSTRKQNQLADVLKYATEGVGQQEALVGDDLNMWYGYNALTGYVTNKRYKTADDRANNMIFGSGALLLKHAGELALNPGIIKPLHKIEVLNDLNLN